MLKDWGAKAVSFMSLYSKLDAGCFLLYIEPNLRSIFYRLPNFSEVFYWLPVIILENAIFSEALWDRKGNCADHIEFIDMTFPDLLWFHDNYGRN